MVRKRTTLPATRQTVEYEPGSAMAGLTEMQRRFVVGKVHYGLDNANAARAAGYRKGTPSKRIATAGYALAHHAGVQAAILEESRKLMRSEGPRSIKVLAEIRDNEQAADKDRIRAAELLLNRGGFNAVAESHITVEHNLSDAEKDKRILALAAELGMPKEFAQKMLISPEDFAKNSAGVYALPEPEPVDPETAAQRKDHAERQRRYIARQKMTPEEQAAERARTRQERVERGKRVYVENRARIGAEEAVPEYVDINLIEDTENEPESQP